MNQADFRAFHRSTCRQLWSYLYRMVSDVELCNDLSQECYVRFLQSAAEFGSNQKARSYLFTIATNLARDHWRRDELRGRWEDEQTEDAVDESADQLPLRLDLAAAMEQLSVMQRSLLWLTLVEGYSHQEAAEIQQIQPASVRVLLSRARAKLARICRDMGIENGS